MIPSTVAEIVTGPGTHRRRQPAAADRRPRRVRRLPGHPEVKILVDLSDNVPVAVNCSVSPVARLVFAGVTAIDTSVADVTVSPVDPVIPSTVAEIFTGPGLTAVASPLLLIVAHVVSDDFQVTPDVKISVDLSDNVPVAVNCSVLPVARLVFAGVTAMDTSVADVTVSPVDPVIPSNVAEIVTGPGLTAVASPLLLIVAHVASDDFRSPPKSRSPSTCRTMFPSSNCSVLPVARLVFAGVTAIDTSVADVTVSPVDPVIPSNAAEIVTGPGLTAVSSPLLIVAHVVSDDFQVTCDVRSSVVSDNVPVAVNCSVLPVARLVLAGVTAIEVSVGVAAVTVNPVEPVIPSNAAEIVTGPGLTAVASPLLLIVAHVVSDDFQVTCDVRSSVVLFDNVPVAVNCSVLPVARLVLAGVTAIELRVGAGVTTN